MWFYEHAAGPDNELASAADVTDKFLLVDSRGIEINLRKMSLVPYDSNFQ